MEYIKTERVQKKMEIVPAPIRADLSRVYTTDACCKRWHFYCNRYEHYDVNEIKQQAYFIQLADYRLYKE